MNNHVQGHPSVGPDIGQITPKLINLALVKDVLEVITPITELTLPTKRSGFSYAVFVLFQTIIQITGLSATHVGNMLNQACKEANCSFQAYSKQRFTNQKQRRFFPDQPSLSRSLLKIAALELTEAFWNAVLFSNLLLMRKLDQIKADLTLIADYTTEPCVKNKADPYCFGTKEGKTVHKTLTFSILSKDLHQIIANFKIFKRQDKLPLFDEIVSKLHVHGFCIKYALLDRGFYRKRLLSKLKQWKITTIMPGRQCSQTKTKIIAYLKKQGTRYCKGFIKLKYVKKQGFPLLRFDLLLCAKRKYNLQQIKLDIKQGTLSIDEATHRIFPLIVLLANSKGITTLHGNESYIRSLYRSRWLIEIAFREMNRLGISQKVQCRNTRLGIMGAKSLVYNFWQLQRHKQQHQDLAKVELELVEFLGMTVKSRYKPLKCF